MIRLPQWLRKSGRASAAKMPLAAKRPRLRRERRVCSLEMLESRALLSAAPLANLANVFATPAVSGLTAAQITSAYLANNLSLITKLKGSITGNGTGQTIAIVDAYNDPNIKSDLATFDSKFGLPGANLMVVSQTGSTTRLPMTDAGWSTEISLDVEWAHAIAPGANIVLVEANSASFSDLLTAVKYAASYAGVSVVSMSWGTDEFRGETSYDSYFTTLAGHTGVTFVASSGDSGVTSWPSVASNVLAVGGTTLTLTSTGAYSSETAWSDSGGGVSKYEPLPSYQKMIGVSATGRVTPDVSYDANPSTGFLVYDTVPGYGATGWITVGGTSAGAPQWAGILAIANQGRVANGLGTLTQANAVLYTLYATKPSIFHDVTSGSNTSRFSATKGFDGVTGMGSPVVNSLVSDLAVATATSTTTSTTTITIAPVGGNRGGWGWGWWEWGGRSSGWYGGSRSGWGSGGWDSGSYNRFGMTAIVSVSVPLAVQVTPEISASTPLVDPAAGIALAMNDAVATPSTALPLAALAPDLGTPKPSALLTSFGFASRQAAAAETGASAVREATPQFYVETPLAQRRLTSGDSEAMANAAVDHVFGELPGHAAVAAVSADAQAQLAPGDVKSAKSQSVGHAAAHKEFGQDAPTATAPLQDASVAAALVFAWQARAKADPEKERQQRWHRPRD